MSVLDTHETESVRSGSAVHQVVLLAGFLAVTAAIAIAHGSPATAYELSIYAATPTEFWVGIALALLCSLAVAFFHPSARLRAGALVLGGEASLAVFGLPLLRGYEFYSAGDALSHLGWARDVVQGDIALTEIIYPGTHTVGVAYHTLLGLPLEQALLLAVLTFAAVFLVFVPLTVSTITNDRAAITVATFSAMMLLPINNISAHLTVFPSTMAIFFLPLVLVLVVVYLTESNGGHFGTNVVGVLLALTSVSMVFIHPQQAANLLLMYVSLTAVLLGYRWYASDRASGTTLRPVYGQATLLALVLVGWSSGHERITGAATAFVTTVVSTVLSQGPTGAGAIAQRTGSLSSIGVTPLEIFTKLFLVSAIYIALTGLLLGGNVLGRMRTDDERMKTLPFFGVALIPVAVVMILYMLGNLETIYFRHLGYIMAIVTVFGSIAIARGLSSIEQLSPTLQRGVTALTAVALGVMLVLSLVAVFPSPYMFQPNSHVTEMRMSGHATAFDYGDDRIQYVGIRTGVDRFRDGLYGTGDLGSQAARESSGVPFQELDGDLTALYDGPRYLVISQADVEREGLWDYFRYSEDGLKHAGSTQDVNRVVSNGGFELYYVAE
jgi:hypothetical protein